MRAHYVINVERSTALHFFVEPKRVEATALRHGCRAGSDSPLGAKNHTKKAAIARHRRPRSTRSGRRLAKGLSSEKLRCRAAAKKSNRSHSSESTVHARQENKQKSVVRVKLGDQWWPVHHLPNHLRLPHQSREWAAAHIALQQQRRPTIFRSQGANTENNCRTQRPNRERTQEPSASGGDGNRGRRTRH